MNMNIDMMNALETTAISFGITSTTLIVILLVLYAWSIIWKGVALWISARNKNYAWFIIFLVVNTFGILEILYIFIFGKKGENKLEEPEKNINI